MHRWTSLFGAMMLVLMLWTGGAAHAAERFECIQTTVEVTGHIEGNQDPAPSSPDQGVAHHHAGCNGHQVAAPSGLASIDLGRSREVVPLAWSAGGVPGRGPEAQLRPPMA